MSTLPGGVRTLRPILKGPRTFFQSGISARPAAGGLRMNIVITEVGFRPTGLGANIDRPLVDPFYYFSHYPSLDDDPRTGNQTENPPRSVSRPGVSRSAPPTSMNAPSTSSLDGGLPSLIAFRIRLKTPIPVPGRARHRPPPSRGQWRWC